MKPNLYIIAICLLFIQPLSAQSKFEPGQRKNNIKLNPTPMLIWDLNNITLTYERLVTPKQSVSLKAGYFVFPRISDDVILSTIELSNRKRYGANIDVEYRFYPAKRNKRPAPDGVFLGPYLGYYGFQFKNNFNVLNTSVDQNGSFTGTLHIFNAGFQLGYQFIFWKRVSLDLILFGPALSYYWGSMKIEGSLDPDQIENISQETIDKIFSRFPFLKTLFSGETLDFRGHRDIWSVGFRYAVQIGIVF
jgi:hypothetical protein